MGVQVLSMAQPPSRFEFIDYSDAAAGRGRLTTSVRRRARILVMDDFLRKQRQQQSASSDDTGKTDTILPQEPVIAPIAERKGRFRLRSRQPKGARSGKTKKFEPSPQVEDKSCLDDHNDDQQASAVPPHTDSPLPIFASFNPSIVSIRNPGQETRSLIDYYLQDYWSNSAAVNPDGVWASITLADLAMLHAKLSLVALHRLDRFALLPMCNKDTGKQSGLDLKAAHLYHRGRAISLIQERLVAFRTSPPDSQSIDGLGSSDSNLIAAITLLTSVDDHSSLVGESQDKHMRPLAAMIDAKGGIDGPEISEALRRVVGWVDLLRATMGERRPLLGSRKMGADEVRIQELLTATGMSATCRRVPPFPTKTVPTNALTRKIHEILDRLSTLTQVAERLDRQRMQGGCRGGTHVRRLYSDAVYNLEHDVASLEDFSSPFGDTSGFVFFWNDLSVLRAFRDAAVVCSYANLRTQNSRLIFARLARRIRDYVGMVLERVRADSGPLPSVTNQSGMSLLLWVMAMGWKAMLLADQGYEHDLQSLLVGRSWFALRMTEVAAQISPLGCLLHHFDDTGEESKKASPVEFRRDGNMALFEVGLSDNELSRLRGEMKEIARVTGITGSAARGQSLEAAWL